jgi:hypothetical protein
MAQEYKVVSLKDRRGEEPKHELRRIEADWREGKPAEDPAKLKRWGLVSARPSEFLICMSGGEVVKAGQGASVFKWPWESISVVPTTVQRLHFTADQVTREKVGVQVTGLAVYRIAAPLIAFRMLNFSYTERAQEKLQQLLVEMFVGAARRLVSNLSVEDCLSKRKEGIAAELIREIAPVVSGRGRPEDETHRGWGVIIDDIEIQEVRILSQSVFHNLQAAYRQEQERRAREAELATQRALLQEQVSVDREVGLSRLASETEVREQRMAAEEQRQLAELAAKAKVATAQHEARVAEAQHELEQLAVQTAAADARHALLESELRLAELETRRGRLGQELALDRARALRAIENDVSPGAIQLSVARELPKLAQAFEQKFGEMHITAVNGANPFGVIAAAVESVLGLARSAGLELPKAKSEGEPG